MRSRLPENFEKNVMAFLLVILVAAMLAAPAARHLSPRHHPFILNLAAGCLAWIASIGMARAAYLGLHARVSVTEGLVSPNKRRQLHTLADTVFIIFAMLAFALGVAVVAEAVRHPSPTSHPFIYASLPTGAALTVVRLVRRIRERFGE